MASAVVEANKRLSDVQGKFVDYGAALSKGLEPAKKRALERKTEREAANKATQGRINKLMLGFKNDIDLIGFADEEKSLVTNTVIGWRNEYADIAREAGKIEDKTSAEYLDLADQMNGIQQKMVNLKNNLDEYAAWKKDYKDNHEKGFYSNAGTNDIALAQSETMLAYPIGAITEGGDLNWNQNENLGTISFQEYEQPFAVAKEAVNAIGQIADDYRRQKVDLTEGQKGEISNKIDVLLDNENILASILSDSDMPGIPTKDLDPEDPQSKQILKDRILNHIYDEQGSLVEPGGNKTREGAVAIKYRETKKALRNAISGAGIGGNFSFDDYYFVNTGGKTWEVYTIDNTGNVLPVNRGGGAIKVNEEGLYSFFGLKK
jgi:hypothetical protein